MCIYIYTHMYIHIYLVIHIIIIIIIIIGIRLLAKIALVHVRGRPRGPSEANKWGQHFWDTWRVLLESRMQERVLLKSRISRKSPAEVRSKQRDPDPKDNYLIRKETSTYKGLHSTFAALFSCWGVVVRVRVPLFACVYIYIYMHIYIYIYTCMYIYIYTHIIHL